MNKYEEVKSVVYGAIDELNEQLLEEQRIEKSMDTVLLGRQSNLDSMALVNLIIIVEEKIVNQFGVNFTLVDERAMSEEESPFKTTRTLVDYISKMLEEVK